MRRWPRATPCARSPAGPLTFWVASGARIALRPGCLLGRLRIDLRGNLADRTGKLVRRLRAGDGVLLRKHECRYARNALVGSFLGLARDQRDILIGGKTPAHVFRVQAAIGCRLHQHVDVSEIATIPEVQL